MVDLEIVLQYLKDNNFKLVDRIDLDNFYFEIGDIVASLTSPHSGNNYSYLLRADFKKDFDRWSNCYFETNFKNYKEMLIAVAELNSSFH